MTHAQNRRERREQNKKLGENNPQFGQPIEGELSPVELAHKERRFKQRRRICKMQLNDVSNRILQLEDKLKSIKENSEDAQTLRTLTQAALKATQARLVELQNKADRLGVEWSVK